MKPDQCQCLERGRGFAVVDDEAVEQLGVELCGPNIGLVEHVAAEPDVGANAEHVGALQRCIQTGDGIGAIIAVDDDFRQHGVVVAAHHVSGDDARVDPDSGAGGFVHEEQGPTGGKESGSRVFGVHPGFDCVAGHRHVVLGEIQFVPPGHPQLPVDEVDAGDHLGDRVFHLQTGVHLHEEELVGSVCRDDELHRPGAGVADRPRRVAGRRADAGTRGGVEQRRGRLLDDLLVPSLEGTFALAEVHHVAVGIGEYLDLDMTWGVHEPFEKQRVIAECRLGLAPGGPQRGRKVDRIGNAVHPFAATACARFDEHREPDVGRCRDQVVVGEPGPGDAGNHGDVAGRHSLPRGDLVAHDLYRRCRGTEEDDRRLRQRTCESRVLREESVSGMHRIGADTSRGSDHRVDLQVALGRGGRAESDGLIGHGHVQRIRICVRVHRNAADSRLPQGADHPAGDLPAVGDQYRVYLFHHHITSERRRRTPARAVRCAQRQAPARARCGCRRDRSRRHPIAVRWSNRRPIVFRTARGSAP